MNNIDAPRKTSISGQIFTSSRNPGNAKLQSIVHAFSPTTENSRTPLELYGPKPSIPSSKAAPRRISKQAASHAKVVDGNGGLVKRRLLEFAAAGSAGWTGVVSMRADYWGRQPESAINRRTAGIYRRTADLPSRFF
jgi:hypothetical protein